MADRRRVVIIVSNTLEDPISDKEIAQDVKDAIVKHTDYLTVLGVRVSGTSARRSRRN